MFLNHAAQAAPTNMNVGPAARAKSSTVFEIPSSDSEESTMEIAGGSEDSSEATLAMMGHNLSFSTPDVARGYKKVEGLGVFAVPVQRRQARSPRQGTRDETQTRITGTQSYQLLNKMADGSRWCLEPF
jgi:hypothetical protein